MNILIATEPDDVHAQLVKLALEDKGHTCILWFMADIPTKQINSIYCSNEHYQWVSENNIDTPIEIDDGSFDVVWWRRPRRPFVPETLHQNDIDFIKKENSIFYDSIPLAINRSWWINPYESIKYANSKPYQLKLAARSGFNIPSTLVSNSPERIKEFILKHDEKNVIYKGFSSHHWLENDRLRLSYTKTVTLDQLPTDYILQMTPGIFQEKLQKKYELRVTCFGGYIVAVKIDSQQHPKGMGDWRVIPPNELKIEPYQLSPRIENMIRVFMKRLGVVFGCFDFIVTPEDAIYFLEINQQGQFLWIEDLYPDLKMLDIFVNFILQKSATFSWDNHHAAISLKDYELLAFNAVRKNMEKHVYLNAIKKLNAS
ncbi:hypothetical protein [Legionella brunensis]|uniref:ATP-grasp domain-containing protein n=1 Tax=Legionella brunensis TaxID=29422 RepID=A0A0W0STS8_9GAMM|nr:hypothetical protein [Legionella brunensis]KTC86668.1 hypothetical protein Lbru_0609 [Legionella brunensis]